MAGTTSIASRMAELKRLKKRAPVESAPAIANSESDHQVDLDETVFASLDTDNPSASADFSARDDDSGFSFDHPVTDGADSGSSAGEDYVPSSNFTLMNDDDTDLPGDHSFRDESAAFEAELRDPDEDQLSADDTPAASPPTFEDFTEAYDAAAPEELPASADVASEENRSDEPVSFDDEDLPTLEFDDDDEELSLSDEASLLDDFALDDTSSGDIVSGDTTADDIADTEDDVALEADDMLELEEEAEASELDTAPDFAAREVDEMVLAEELNAEDAPPEIAGTAASAESEAANDLSEAPYSTQNEAGDVTVIFDDARSTALKEYARDMNCSVEDIVVTALDWYLDALFSEENEARSA